MTARAKITILNWKNPESNHSREIYHCFCARENDWGYSNFMTMKVCIYTTDSGIVFSGTNVQGCILHTLSIV